MMTQILRYFAVFIGLFLFLPTPASTAGELLPEAVVGDNGLHNQSWFVQSFLDIGEDLADAQVGGKGLVVIFEQAGCPYCREMHRVNLRDLEIVSLIRENFDVVQLDLRGNRETTDTDGEVMEERDLARKWGVIFTPTLIFLPNDADPGEKPGKELAASIMPGYFKPFHFATMFDFVASGAYKTDHFQDFLNARATRMREAGKDVTIWD